MLHARLVLSQVARGRIRGIDSAAARAIPGVFAVYSSADMAAVTAAGPDQPLARGEVYFNGQPVAAVLAADEAIAADAAALVVVDYEERPAVLEPDAAMLPDSPLVLEERSEGLDDASVHGGAASDSDGEAKPRNVSSVVRTERGDVEAALAASDEVVEMTLRMPRVHQGFIEPHVVVAAPEPGGGVVVWSPTQGHFYARDEVAKLLGLSPSRVRVHSMPVGGGFGGKVVLLEPLTALLALASGHPVSLALTRTEEFQVGRTTPASSIDIKLGGRNDGTLTGLDARVVYDNGATSGWHGGMTGVLLGMPYRFEAFRMVAYEVSTNKTPADAYRGPAGTQASFALESALDELAMRLQVDPVELRLRNAFKEGDVHADMTWPRIGLVECLEAARAHPLYTQPAAEGEGVGIAVGAWGGAFGPAAAGCRVEADGTLTLQVGSVDISGSSTSLAMIAAESFGVAVDRVRVVLADTDSAPMAPVAGGSGILYSVGPAVQMAALDAREQLLAAASEQLEVAPEDLEVVAGDVRVRGVPERTVAVGSLAAGGPKHAPIHGHGRATQSQNSPAFTVHIARVHVDRETGHVGLSGYAAIQDVGRAVNMPEVVGQIQGGAMQGIGRTLGEQLVYDEAGQLRTASFLDYEVPTADVVSEIEVTVIEIPSPHAPLGTRGVGEPPAIPGPAAIANAIRAATGVRISSLPVDASLLLG